MVLQENLASTSVLPPSTQAHHPNTHSDDVSNLDPIRFSQMPVGDGVNSQIALQTGQEMKHNLYR